MTTRHASVTTSKASLIGGIVVATATLVLWLAVSREFGWSGPVVWGAGLVVAAVIGVWVRVADL